MRTTRTLAATAVAVVAGTLVLSACGTSPAGSGGWALASLPASPVADQPVAPTPATTGATAAPVVDSTGPRGDPNSTPDPDPAGADVRDTGGGHGVHGRGVRHR